MTDALLRLRMTFLMAMCASVVVFLAVAGTTSMPLDGDLLRQVAAHVESQVDHPARVHLAPRNGRLALEVRYVPSAERLSRDATAQLENRIMEQAMIRYPGFIEEVLVEAVAPEDLLAGRTGPGDQSQVGRAADLRRRLDAEGILAYGDYHWPVKARMLPWKYLLIHHSAADSGSVEIIDRGHRKRGPSWKGIGYDFVIGNGQGAGDGEVRETFRWTDQEEGAHAGVVLYNQQAVGICLIGNFSSRDELASEWKRLRRSGEPPEPCEPSPEQMESLRFLAVYLLLKLNLEPDCILRHCQVKPDICPGGNFPTAEFLAGVRKDLKRLRSGR